MLSTDLPTQRSWRDHAACDGEDPAHFDLDSPPPLQRQGLATCRRCPVRDECFAEAIEHRAVGVIRGGRRMPRDTSSWNKHGLAKGCETCGMARQRGTRWCYQPCRPSCGTDAGHQAHRYRREPACEPCRWPGPRTKQPAAA